MINEGKDFTLSLYMNEDRCNRFFCADRKKVCISASDPAFHRWGRQLNIRGVANLLFGKFLLKTVGMWKKLGRAEASLGSIPLNPPLILLKLDKNFEEIFATKNLHFVGYVRWQGSGFQKWEFASCIWRPCTLFSILLLQFRVDGFFAFVSRESFEVHSHVTSALVFLVAPARAERLIFSV